MLAPMTTAWRRYCPARLPPRPFEANTAEAGRRLRFEREPEASSGEHGGWSRHRRRGSSRQSITEPGRFGVLFDRHATVLFRYLVPCRSRRSRLVARRGVPRRLREAVDVRLRAAERPTVALRHRDQLAGSPRRRGSGASMRPPGCFPASRRPGTRPTRSSPTSTPGNCGHGSPTRLPDSPRRNATRCCCSSGRSSATKTSPSRSACQWVRCGRD